MRRAILAAAGLVWFSACGACSNELDRLTAPDSMPGGSGDASVFRPDAEPSDAPDAGARVSIVLPSAREVSGGAFTTSQTCATCHSSSSSADAMRDERGQNIAPFDLWESSMMANAARDPLFRAVMSAEIAAIPNAKAAIEAKCLSCHSPMATRSSANFDLEQLYGGSDVAQLGLDGVSCTVCHQIQPDGLGEERSFSGRFTVSEAREMFGPHANPFAMPMIRHTGYTPTQGGHVTESALCGSCHTLFTDALDHEGKPTGERLAEQTPFLEWRNSSFANDDQTCQSCHLPTTSDDGVSIRTAIARNPGGFDFGPVSDRAPYGRHTLVGGNTLVPAILRDNAGELNPQASRDAFDETVRRAREQLSRAAQLELTMTRTGDRLELAVDVVNLTGHKLPTAHPTRRMWLRVEVRRADTVVFLSGAYDGYNRLLGSGGNPLAFELTGGPLAPHVDRTSDADSPAVFESVMLDAEGQPTSTLLRGARYGKDNRILPAGWRADGPDATFTAPVGVEGDETFVAGRDRVTYVIEAPAGGGPYEAQVSLLYTPLSPRWYADLLRYSTAEVQAFAGYYEAADRRPETMASATTTSP